MAAFKALAVSLLLGLAAADECPALSNTFGQKPKNLFELTTVDCRVGIQAAECAINVRQSYGQSWAAFRINHNHDCNHGAPYGDCCCFNGKPPVEPDNLDPNPSVWMFFWDDEKTGQNTGIGPQCIQDPTTGCCGRQDAGHFTVTGGCPYGPSTVKYPFDDQGKLLPPDHLAKAPLVVDLFGRVGDGCPASKDAGNDQTTEQTDSTQQISDNTKQNSASVKQNDGSGSGDGSDTGAGAGSGAGAGAGSGAGAGAGSGGGSRLARFRRLRRQSSSKSSSKKGGGSGGDAGGDKGGSSTGSGGSFDRNGDRIVKSGAGPGGFPKCGPLGKFGSEKQCQKDIRAQCKPGVKNKGTGGNMGKMPKTGTGDLDGTTCTNGKSSAGGLASGGSTTTKSTTGGGGDSTVDTQQNSGQDTQQNTGQDPQQASSRRLRRWTAMDSAADLLKRWPANSIIGGNQYNRGNTGQLPPKGKCCWCHAENGGGGGGSGGGSGGGKKKPGDGGDGGGSGGSDDGSGGGKKSGDGGGGGGGLRGSGDKSGGGGGGGDR